LPARAQATRSEPDDIAGRSLEVELENRLAAASQYLGEEL
jgi:hypothetical protein